MIKSKKSFFAIIFAFIVGICAIILPLTFMRKNKNVVFADTVSSTFTSSGFLFPICYTNANGSVVNNVKFLNFRFSLTYDSSSSNYTIQFIDRYLMFASDNALTLQSNINVINSSSVNVSNGTTLVEGNSYSFVYNGGTTYYGYRFDVRISRGYGSTSPLSPGTMSYVSILNGGRAGSTNYGYLDFKYVDSINNYIMFTFYNLPWSYLSNVFVDRTYFFGTGTGVSDTQAYQSGYNDGLNSGYESGYSQGQQIGYSNGDTAGYARGFTAGQLSANDYSFIGLIGATIDAPIQALTGLLNFDILGVNLSAFVYGLFTITLVIVIIKYIKGGK